MCNWAEFWSVVSDIAVGVAALVGTVVAILGLQTWKKQLKGSTEYELSRRLLKCSYRLRDSMTGLRHPAMFGSEMPSPSEDEAKLMSAEARRFFGTSGAYAKRYERVLACSTDLQAELLGAEAIWGAEVKQKFKVLFDLQHELWMAVFTYLRSIDPQASESSRLAHAKIALGRRDVMYDMSTEEPDEFTRDVQKAIKTVEDVLRPHLKN